MIGYEFLLSKITRPMMPPRRPARIAPVTRKEPRADSLAIPRNVAPTEVDILSHVLFALKHEDLNIAILHEALSLVPAEEMLAALLAQPASAYIRQACFFWEKANGRPLPGDPNNMGGNYVDVFDPETYYTGQVWERHQRYRVNFNGIGPYDYCPVVLRDAKLEAEGDEVIARLGAWVGDPLNAQILDRVMGWAYLSETRDSYAIEHETPSPGKEQAFLQAMEQLREKTPLSEEYLVQLQNTVISSPLAHEQQFRAHQNWLQRGGHGALSVRYVPPSPDGMLRLMDGFMRMANAQDDVPALIKAALVSFGFVYIHPFMDGNGRLSRLLAHHCLNLKGVLPDVNGNPAILPLSVAMKKNEKQYLEALESFSKPARALWSVISISDSDFTFQFKSTPLAYAHWSGQQAARFVIDCAKTALEQSLVEETAFLHAYDKAFQLIDKNCDLPDRSINLLIQWIKHNHGKMPERRKNAPEIASLKAEQLAGIERIVATAFGLSGA
jgi:hypothetical protein